MFDRRKAVSDNEAGAPFHQAFHALLDQRFGKRIHGAGGFIHHKDIWVCQDRPGDADQLFLTYGEQIAALADVLVIAVLEIDNEVVSSS